MPLESFFKLNNTTTMNGFGSEEPQPSVAPVKVDNQRYAFLIMRQLQRMDPRAYRYFIHDLLVIFFTVDVMLYPRIIDWLKSEFGLASARIILSSSIKSWRTLPLHFEETVSHGWVVSCRSGGLKDPVESEKAGGNVGDGSDEEEESDEDDGTGEAFVEEIQGITEDGLVNGFLLAQIREGDVLQFNSHSHFWWMVHELRPRKKTILLSRQRTVQGAVVMEETPDGMEVGEHRVQESSLQAGGEDDEETLPSGLKQFTTRSVTEYKEVPIHAMFGALVRREGVLTARTIESLERDGNCNFDFALLSYAAAEEYNAQLMEATALKAKAPPRKSLKKKDQFNEADGDSSNSNGGVSAKKSKKAEYEDRRVVVIFKMPLPCVAAAVDKMKSLADEYPVPPETEEDDDNNNNYNNSSSSSSKNGNKMRNALMKDPVWHMQHQAQIKVWVSRWEENVRARKLLNAIDPYLCLHRDKWLLVCKVLRVISRGGDTLLPDFINWTRSAGNDGLKRATDAPAAWASVRPITTCDLEPLATARAYLRQRGAGHKKSYYDAQGRLRPEAMNADPKARLVLEAAALHMSDRVLTFFDQSLIDGKGGGQPGAGLDQAGQDIDGSAAIAPCAIYEYDLELFSQLRADELGTRTSHIGTYLEERQTSCFITVNDCLYVREPLTGQTQANSNSQVWVLVLAIDLLFARVRVVQCHPDVPPPHCWSSPHHTPLINSTPCWISISKLWDVTVCRQLGVNINPRSRGIGNDNTATASSSKTMKEKEKGPPLGLYAVWITPMPSQHEALAILSQLGDIEIGSAVLAETTAKGKDRKEKKAGGGKKATFKEYMPREATKPTTKCGNRRPMELTAAEKQAEASRSAPVGTKETGGGKVRIEAVRFYVDSVIVQWHLSLDNDKNHQGHRGVSGSNNVIPEKKKIIPEYVIELTLTTSPKGWTEVYRGTGAAAQISGLEPLTQYYCRLKVISHPHISYSCVVMTTLGAPSILSVPTVTRWEKGTASGSARGLVVINSNDDLPPGCFFQIEASIGNAESHDHHAAQEWAPAARTRGNEVWIVGPYSGHSVVLRARIINQDGQPGPPSHTGVCQAPSFKAPSPK